MTHCTKEILTAYYKQQLSNGDELGVENHLQHCETCMDCYLNLIEATEIQQTVSKQFTDQLLVKIEKQVIKPNHSTYKRKQLDKTVRHFLLAAGLTLLLTLAGLFQEVATITDESFLQEQTSITEQLLEKSTGLLNLFKGGNN
ncbi:hypothetical protein SAMN04488134_101131 [Amphibacillus marinus]|uniref:Zinc-finger n=1 Tax=Amphibacillus marinus TaxID=872970 RepID=A0A1H8GPF9_9BACI|nr:hypothetical protein [Amphibacillus marinus]SEN45883.1 hypothetical protein SAMN04488134_101131 [Amphibacillus marinus]